MEKNKGGRPQKNDKKKKPVKVLFTEKEYSEFKVDKAKVNIKTDSAYLFRCWENNKFTNSSQNYLTEDLIYQIKKIGNNLNQIAFEANVKKNDPFSTKILDNLSDIKNEIKKVLKEKGI